METRRRWRTIPSVLDLKTLESATKSGAREVLLSNVHIGNLAAISARLHEAHKQVLVQSDLIGGFKADPLGLRLLRNQYGVDGIFTSSHSTLALAKRVRIRRYFRVFLMDSRSLITALETLREFSGDGIELLPGQIAVEVVSQFREVVGDRDILAGGFVHSQSILDALKSAGFDGATTSNSSMWSE